MKKGLRVREVFYEEKKKRTDRGSPKCSFFSSSIGYSCCVWELVRERTLTTESSFLYSDIFAEESRRSGCWREGRKLERQRELQHAT